MRLHEVSRTWQDGKVRLSGLITREANPEPFELYFEYPEAVGDWVVDCADPFAIAMLVPAMYWQEALQITPPVSPRLARYLPEIRGAFATWRKHLLCSRLELTPGTPRAHQREPRAAAFFSAGVDSFHTALRRQQHEPMLEPLTHLLFMQGIETPLPESRGVEESQRRVEQIAARLGLGCIAGTTNLRSFFPRNWERYYAGSGLAATAVSLGDGFGTVCIPASSTYDAPHWGGTNLLTDPMFSTEYVAIHHDGADTKRANKVRAILEWDAPLVREHLRVCIHNHGGAWNCGKCYKCVRTAIVLEVLGQLEGTTLFAESPRGNWHRTLPADHTYFTREALTLARELGTRPDLIRMLQRIVNRRARFDAAVEITKHSPLVHMLPAFQWLRGQMGIPARER
jgi:hypothetical protein